MPHREGFVCAGTWCMDLVHTIERYPQTGESALITREQARPGGSAFDVLTALRRSDVDLPLYALGVIGDDENGRELLSACHKIEVDTFQVQVSSEAPTAHTVVMHAEQDHSQTRFYFPGANRLLGAEHFDFRHCLASWCHLSDFELFERLHLPNQEFGLAAESVLQAAHEADLVTALTTTSSENTQAVRAMLQSLDYLILNEKALGAYADRMAHSNARGLKEAAEQMFQKGLRHGLAVHCKDRSFAMLRSGDHAELKLSQNDKAFSIASFSAGFLYGRYAGRSLEHCLATTSIAK